MTYGSTNDLPSLAEWVWIQSIGYALLLFTFMYLADAFNWHMLWVLASPENRTHDLGVVRVFK